MRWSSSRLTQILHNLEQTIIYVLLVLSRRELKFTFGSEFLQIAAVNSSILTTKTVKKL